MLTRPSAPRNVHAQGDVHHHIVVRQQLDKLRIDLQPLQLRLQLHQVGPAPPSAVSDSSSTRRMTVCSISVNSRMRWDGPRTAQQPIDNDKSKIRWISIIALPSRGVMLKTPMSVGLVKERTNSSYVDWTTETTSPSTMARTYPDKYVARPRESSRE